MYNITAHEVNNLQLHLQKQTSDYDLNYQEIQQELYEPQITEKRFLRLVDSLCNLADEDFGKSLKNFDLKNYSVYLLTEQRAFAFTKLIGQYYKHEILFNEQVIMSEVLRFFEQMFEFEKSSAALQASNELTYQLIMKYQSFAIDRLKKQIPITFQKYNQKLNNQVIMEQKITQIYLEQNVAAQKEIASSLVQQCKNVNWSVTEAVAALRMLQEPEPIIQFKRELQELEDAVSTVFLCIKKIFPDQVVTQLLTLIANTDSTWIKTPKLVNLICDIYNSEYLWVMDDAFCDDLVQLAAILLHAGADVSVYCTRAIEAGCQLAFTDDDIKQLMESSD